MQDQESNLNTLSQDSNEQDRDSELIDCRTNDNRDFNHRMRDMGRDDLYVKSTYSRAEIAEMRAKCKRWLGS